MVDTSVLAGVLIGVVVLAVGAFVLFAPAPAQAKEVHVHADFKVFLNGAPVDFNQENYMEENAGAEGRFIHMHGGGDVIHRHAEGQTLGMFFSSIGFDFNSECFVTDTGTAYCNERHKTLKMFVNRQPSRAFDAYVPADLDSILISYGDEFPQELLMQLEQVSDRACIESEKCPERGNPTRESGCRAGEVCPAFTG